MTRNPAQLAKMNRDQLELNAMELALDRHRCSLLLARTSPTWIAIKARYMSQLRQRQAQRRAAEKQAQEDALATEFRAHIARHHSDNPAPNGLIYGPMVDFD